MTLTGRVIGTTDNLSRYRRRTVDNDMDDDMIVGSGGEPQNFAVCKLPMGAYQFATFIHRPDSDAFDETSWTPPIYTVEFEAALRTPFAIERCMMLIDPNSAAKLAKVLHVIADGSADSMGTLESLMATEQYGKFRR